jgi:hypothetical protein
MTFPPQDALAMSCASGAEGLLFISYRRTNGRVLTIGCAGGGFGSEIRP